MERVMMIYDVSKQVSWSTIRWVVNDSSLSLKAGDELMILGVVHHLYHPTTLDFLAAAKLLGYETTLMNSNYMSEEEIDGRGQEQTHTYMEMLVLSKQCQAQKIKLHVDVRVGVSRKIAAVKAAMEFDATFVVLDREMKNEKKYFMKKLRCGIWKVKTNNTASQVRAPIQTSPNTNTQLIMSYDEMIPFSSSSQELSSLVAPRLKSSPIDHSKTVVTAPSSRVERRKDGAQNNNSNNNNNNNTTTANNSINNNNNHNNVEAVDEVKITISKSICSFCKNRRPKPPKGKIYFTYGELHEATEGFFRENYLSEGGFGSVYKGKLKNGLKIAVKQHKNMSLQGEKEFKSEVDVLSRARHDNLVMLLGSCSEGSHRLLVYEYVCNGSLHDHLPSDARLPLNWEQRLKIALGAAKGLEYLHAQKIIHRDIRPNNILITHDYESLLGDFGLARTRSCDDSNHFSNESVVGTMGYVAPEYAESGKVSTKTDVYSFGVVLLQLITGLSNTDKNLKGRSLLGWALPLLEQKNYPCLIDKRIVDSHDVHQLFGMVQLVEQCLSKDPNKRPSMKCVVITLTDIIEESAMRLCSPSKTYSISYQKEVKDEDVNEKLYLSNNDTSKPEKGPTSIEETKRKQNSEVKRVGFKSSEIKPVCRSKIAYDEMIL